MKKYLYIILLIGVCSGSIILESDDQIQNSIYSPFNLGQDISSIPYNDLKEVFNVEKIIESINKQ